MIVGPTIYSTTNQGQGNQVVAKNKGLSMPDKPLYLQTSRLSTQE